jgi:hypothetical protein
VLAALPLFAAALLAGITLQRHGRAGRLRDSLWLASFCVLSPVLVLSTVQRIDVDRNLVESLGAAAAAAWLVLLIGYGYARAVARDRHERGALALAAGFGNTGALGYPLAQLAFGPAGLPLAVLYDRLSWLVPQTGVSAAVARAHCHRDPGLGLPGAPRLGLLNPPIVAGIAALALRLAGVQLPAVDDLAAVAAVAVGPVGFLLLGLSLPLDRPHHAPGEVGRAAGAAAIRLAGGPAVLFLVARSLGIDVPGVFYLLAGMPCAFHLVTLARVYDVRPALVRLLVLGSTALAVTGAATATLLR